MSKDLSPAERQELERLRQFHTAHRATHVVMRSAVAATVRLYEALDDLSQAWREDGYPGGLMEYISRQSSRDMETVAQDWGLLRKVLQAKKS